ncbi:16805_t:CDS:1, partial [Gigaspora margarita]
KLGRVVLRKLRVVPGRIIIEKSEKVLRKRIVVLERVIIEKLGKALKKKIVVLLLENNGRVVSGKGYY